MINEEKIKLLLDNTKWFKQLADTYEDIHVRDINHSIYDYILNDVNVPYDFDSRKDYYALFADYEFGIADVDETINKLVSMTDGYTAM